MMNNLQHKISKQDTVFIQKMETGEFPVAEFNHKAHLRLAYVYLVEYQLDEAVSAMRSALLSLLKKAGINPDEKYHETLTQAWIMAVHHFMAQTPNSSSADEFIAQHPEMLDSAIMKTHYSATALSSSEARKSFIEPDISPIPKH